MVSYPLPTLGAISKHHQLLDCFAYPIEQSSRIRSYWWTCYYSKTLTLHANCMVSWSRRRRNRRYKIVTLYQNFFSPLYIMRQRNKNIKSCPPAFRRVPVFSFFLPSTASSTTSTSTPISIVSWVMHRSQVGSRPSTLPSCTWEKRFFPFPVVTCFEIVSSKP